MRSGHGIERFARQQLKAAGVTNITTTQRHGAGGVETLSELEPGAELVVVGKTGERCPHRRPGR